MSAPFSIADTARSRLRKLRLMRIASIRAITIDTPATPMIAKKILSSMVVMLLLWLNTDRW
jgi:hypothetical protein